MLAILFPKNGDLLKPYGARFVQARFTKPSANTLPHDRPEWQPIDRFEWLELPVTKLANHLVTDNACLCSVHKRCS